MQYQYFQQELDAGKGLPEEMVKSLEPTLKLLFMSHCEGKDPVQLAVELVPERSVVVCWLSESVASISASHALGAVKSHYSRVDLGAVEEGYAAEEDVDRLHGEVAPSAIVLVKDMDLDRGGLLCYWVACKPPRKAGWYS
uniref:Uncharacterized protein n=1 Tax=Oryza punctata TaxID=4537 RepID=A0A0E0MLU7_ORYPU